MKSNRGRRCEKTGKCDGCGFKMHLSLHKKEWLCRGCLVGDEAPLNLADFVTGTCPLGNLEMMDGDVPGGIAHGSAFARQLDAALEREGWAKSQDDVKAEMWQR